MEQGMSFTDWLIVIGVLFVGFSPFMLLGMLVSSAVGGLLGCLSGRRDEE